MTLGDPHDHPIVPGASASAVDSAAASAAVPRANWRDDLAYVLPMLLYLGITYVETQFPAWLPWLHALKISVVAATLILFRKHYTRITWRYAWLGAIVGVLVVVQWVGMEKLLGDYPKFGQRDAFNPLASIASPIGRWGFIILRIAGLSLLVPVMEELFWRDWLWRTLAAPNNFRMACIGEWDRTAFVVVALAFASVHPEWITAIVCGFIYGGLLLYTRSLGSVIVAHGVTNLLLGLYVLWTHDWIFW